MVNAAAEGLVREQLMTIYQQNQPRGVTLKPMLILPIVVTYSFGSQLACEDAASNRYAGGVSITFDQERDALYGCGRGAVPVRKYLAKSCFDSLREVTWRDLR